MNGVLKHLVAVATIDKRISLLIQVGLKGQQPIIEGKLSKPIKAEECLWSLDNSALEIALQKIDRVSWWDSVIEGDPKIDTSKVCT